MRTKNKGEDALESSPELPANGASLFYWPEVEALAAVLPAALGTLR